MVICNKNCEFDVQLDEGSYEPFHWSDDVRHKVLNKLACYDYKILYNYKVKTTLDVLKQNNKIMLLLCYFVFVDLRCHLRTHKENVYKVCHVMSVDTL